ncbi:MAG TPA: glycosyltransferase family 2 protein [Candidatus Angelobacter sp.]
MTISVVIISYNEEANIERMLESVMPLVRDGKGEIIVVDSGSTDRTVEIAESHGAKVLIEEWKGYAAQKNSAIEKALGDWILSLDADEALSSELAEELLWLMGAILIWEKLGMPVDDDSESKKLRDRGLAIGLDEENLNGFWIPRQNHFLGRWIKHGGFWPDPKLRLFRRGMARFEERLVHEDVKLTNGSSSRLKHALIHNSYPTFSDYIAHMNQYSSLGAEMAVAKGERRLLILDIAVRPLLTFIYNYFFRLGFLDGREGFLLHVGHAIYVSWKYMKIWELQQ